MADVRALAGGAGGVRARRRAGPAAELETLSVLPDERGNGLGAALLDAVDAELERIGVAEVALTVVEPNLGARRLYERRGFETLFVHMRRRRR